MVEELPHLAPWKAARPEVRAYLAGKPVKVASPSRPYTAYTDGEWERLVTVCRRTVEDSWVRLKRTLQSAAVGNRCWTPRTSLTCKDHSGE